jgi:hypothetical protein
MSLESNYDIVFFFLCDLNTEQSMYKSEKKKE